MIPEGERFKDYFYHARNAGDLVAADEKAAHESQEKYWSVYDSTLYAYGHNFPLLFPEYGRKARGDELNRWLQDRKRRGGTTFILDVAGQAGFTEEFVDGSRGVTLNDLRTDERRSLDAQFNSDIIEGNILRGDTVRRIRGELVKMGGSLKGYDLILLSPYAGWGGITPDPSPDFPDIYRAQLRYQLIRNLYRVLSSDNGRMLIDMHTSPNGTEETLDLLNNGLPEEADIYSHGRYIRIDKLAQKPQTQKSIVGNLSGKFSRLMHRGQ